MYKKRNFTDNICIISGKEDYMDYTSQQYLDYLDKKSPDSPIWKNMLMAFLVGGAICTVGQWFLEFYKNTVGLSEEESKTAECITMIFLGALLTGLNLYNKIGKHAGAGSIVPITGFANSVVSPAMEFKKEGLVLGLASKMFVIAGPVLVYGITASVGVGLIYWIIKTVGG